MSEVTYADGFRYSYDRKYLILSQTWQAFPMTKYTEFLIDVRLVKVFSESGMTSPKKFVREQHMDKWLAYQVIKRMEGK